ncbi:hypothetical protein C359_04403 [Cryptococcus neoformans Bt120]|nr:hypothetical protein C359_04403 [Cryptococcus neoformans var. grubii Bt120]
MEARSTYYLDISAGSPVPDVNALAILPTIFMRGQTPQPVIQNQVAVRGLTSIPEAPSSANRQEQQGIVHLQPRPMPQDIPEKDHKRSSAGTFGTKNGEYPPIYSITSSNAPPERHIPSNVFDTPRATNQTKRRSLSYSPTSRSTSPQKFSTSKTVDDTATVAMRLAMGTTSPDDRAGQRETESESQIEDYLRRQSKGNQRRIAPASSSAGFRFESTTDLDNDLEDEMKTSKKEFRKSKVDQMLGEGAEYARMTMEMNRKSVRKALEGTVKQTTGPVPPPRTHKHCPSAPANSLHTSSPTKSINSVRKGFTYAEALVSPVTTTNFPTSHFHSLSLRKSASIDSLPSLHPSLTDSVNLERRPLLKQPLPPLPTQHRPTQSTITISRPSLPPFPSVNQALSTSSTLTSSQRTILIRRTRKLEALLGETLSESQISQHVVDPLNSVKEFDTQMKEGWPDSPPAGWGKRVPEWEREDCLVQRVKGENGEEGGEGKAKSLAQKTLAALNLTSKKPEGDDLKVYVSRQMRVTETVTYGEASTKASVNRAEPVSVTVSPTSANSISADSQWPAENGGDEGKKVRRQQLAKLQRLLGVPIPPEVVNPASQIDPHISYTPDKRRDSDRTLAATTSSQADSLSDQSFMTFDDPSTGNRWSRLRNLHKRMGNGSMAVAEGKSLVSDDGASFMDLGEDKKLLKEEKAFAKKKVAKLELVLGDKPPSSMYNPSSSFRAPLSNNANNQRLSLYESYSASLRGLLYLVDHDQPKLAQVMDSLHCPLLDDQPEWDHRSRASASSGNRAGIPSSPILEPLVSNRRGTGDVYDFLQSDPPRAEFRMQQNREDGELEKPDSHSRTARKRRTGKLSQFFGESVEQLSKPLDEEPTNTVPCARRQSMSASRQAGGGKWKGRRDTIDAMLGEMWRSVQTEMGRGGLKKDEVDRLGDLMSVLRERKRERNGYWESV